MKIESNGDLYALLVSDQPAAGTEWFGNQYEPLQASRWRYAAGKEFRAHKHILNPRTIKRTQEAFVVIRGKLQIDISDEKNYPIGSLTAGPGEAIIVYRGYHFIKVLEDCVAYEIKAGQYTSVSDDKEFLE